MSTDAIVLLKADHKEIREQFRRFATAGDNAAAAKGKVDAKTIVLIENVTHHMDEEEQDWFPKVREGLGRKQLQDLGARMIELKKTAPTSPAQPSALKKAIDAVIA